MGRVLSAWFVVGALVMAGLACGFPVFPVLAVVWLVGYFVVAGIAIGDAVRLAERGDLGALERSANGVKLAAIPFFVLNFVALTRVVVSAGAADREHFGLRGFLIAVLFVVLTYLVLLLSSAYVIGCLVVLRRRELIGRRLFGLHLILQFFFAVDIASAVVVVEIARHRLGTARAPGVVARHLLTAVLAVASALSVVWVIEYGSCGDGWGLPCYDPLLFELAAVPTVMFFVLVVVPVVPLVAFRTAVRGFLAGDLELLRRPARAVKLVMIPLFVQNFLVAAVILGLLSFLPLRMARETRDFWLIGAVASLGFVPVAIAAFLMLLPTSIYGITHIALLRRHRLISTRYCVTHVLLQLVFVADIVSTVVVTRRSRSNA